MKTRSKGFRSSKSQKVRAGMRSLVIAASPGDDSVLTLRVVYLARIIAAARFTASVVESEILTLWTRFSTHRYRTVWIDFLCRLCSWNTQSHIAYAVTTSVTKLVYN